MAGRIKSLALACWNTDTMRLPFLHSFVDSVRTKSITQSIDYLLRQRTALSKYKNLEDFALRDEECATKTDEDPKVLMNFDDQNR